MHGFCRPPIRDLTSGKADECEAARVAIPGLSNDFPGNSGETLRISIAPEDRAKKVKRVD